MIIAVTGTPGTGKTAVSRALAERLDYAYVDVNAVVEDEDVETAYDPGRDTTAVDVDSLAAAVADRVGGDAVLDGHLAHHVPADLTVVLRCSPAELEQRLAAKGWSDEKIAENVEAEVVDLLLQEAVRERQTVAEIDTTGKTPEQVAQTITDMVSAGVPDRYRPGHVDWTDALG